MTILAIHKLGLSKKSDGLWGMKGVGEQWLVAKVGIDIRPAPLQAAFDR